MRWKNYSVKLKSNFYNLKSGINISLVGVEFFRKIPSYGHKMWMLKNKQLLIISETRIF